PILPARLVARLPVDAADASVRRGDTTLVGAEPVDTVAVCGPRAIGALDTLAPGFWIGWCSFELGHVLERVAPRFASLEPPAVPDVAFARFDSVAIVDADGAVRVIGDGPGRVALERAAAAVRSDDVDVDVDLRAAVPRGRWHSSLDRDAYGARVEVILDLLRAGEC